MDSYSIDYVNNHVLRKHHLTDDTKIDEIVQITHDIFGLHATLASTPFLSLFARSKNFSKKILIKELSTKKSIAKIRCVRKTIYIIPKDNFSSVFTATRTMVDLISRRHFKFLGITEQQYEEISNKILKIIKGKGLTTKEIKQILGTELNISPIVNLMCDRGLLIRGVPRNSWKSNIHIYSRFDEFFPDIDLTNQDELKAKELIIKKYIAAFGPVTLNDIFWWTGFPKGQITSVINKIQDEIIHTEISEIKSDFMMLQSDRKYLSNIKLPSKNTINLLPCLDPYLMGYKDRDRYIDKEYFNFIFDRSGNAVSSIMKNGIIIGVWDFIDPIIKIFLFKEIKKVDLEEIINISKHLGRFISGKDIKIKECKSMIPLNQRTAGSFMSPLKNV